MTKENKKSVAIFFVPVGSHYWIYLRLFAMLSSGKTKICQKDFILPSAIFYCVQFHTPKLHTYIQLDTTTTIINCIDEFTASPRAFSKSHQRNFLKKKNSRQLKKI